MARTKIVATLGPATHTQKAIWRLINLGADVFRINFSHGDETEHAELIRNTRAAAGHNPIAIMGDLPGPKLRCGIIQNEPAILKKHSNFLLTTKEIAGSAKAVSVNYKRLPSDVKPGEHIFLNDGNIELAVESVKGTDIRCRVITGGALTSHEGINLPNTVLSVPALTRKDREEIKFGIAQGLDFFALSFVKCARDIKEAKRAIRAAGGDTPVIAKIEKHEAIDNLEEIIEAADGAMVARGDLGIEIPLQDVPIAQKRIITLCNARCKPVITATQMLESMITKARPTRAEVTDIANAILDGTDAVMLSGETAIGKYPFRAAKLMDTIAQTTEESLEYKALSEKQTPAEAGSVPDAISMATCEIARTLNVAAIVCLSATGYTARLVARYRPNCPILVFTLRPEVQRRLVLTWGVIPYVMKEAKDVQDIRGVEAVVNSAISIAKKHRRIRKGQRVVVTAGLPLGIGGTTNMLRVVEV